jgi:calcium/calmodulin-dependent protein kinase I
MSEQLIKHYEVGQEIGRGRFGTVHRCFSRRTGESFAVKSIDKSLLADSYDRECVEHESKLHRIASVGNPHVVSLHNSFEDESSIHLVLDLCSGTDLLDRVSSDAPLPEPEAAALAKELLEAIAACHHRGVAHRDIKPDNIMFDMNGELKLADFGSAAWFGGLDGEQKMEGIVGTPYYVAPEVISGRRYSEKVDVWSAGVVIYMLLSGTAPFDGESAGDIFEAVLRANLRFPTKIFGWVSPMAKDLLRRMLSRDVTRRFSAEEALSKFHYFYCLNFLIYLWILSF